jgi:hypothetical protein
MPIKWKKTPRFNPDIPLRRIASVRTRNPNGKGSSFSGWDLNYSLPLLHSMLAFPEVARDMDHANLIWRAVANDPGDLSKDSFLTELNRQLDADLAQRDEVFHLLTSWSLSNRVKLGSCTVAGVRIKFLGAAYPRKFMPHRTEQLNDHSVPAAESPPQYTRVVATVRAKKASLAFNAAMRAVDLERSLWCLFGNSQMEIMGRSWAPINAIRLGAAHTVHVDAGPTANSEFWFEPYHAAPEPYKPSDALSLKRLVRRTQRRLNLVPYRQDLVEALLLYVRALDEWNQNSAFARLWSAIERLTSPGYADYDAVVRRCAFLWREADFATQTLEHLREYRNLILHTGTESAQAKTYCFQLQQHFRPLLLFHINNAGRFATLAEANRFLDLPTDALVLKQQQLAISRARRFRSPK